MGIVMTTNYSEQTEGARLSIEGARAWVERACANVSGTAGLCFADYGAADGGTALSLYRTIVAAAGSRPLTLILNDLPGADWDTLAANGRRAIEGRDGDVVYVSPRSFYERIAPASTVHVAFSATAMHWLSKKPLDLANHTHANAAPPSEARSAISRQAEHDWASLVRRRHDELVSRGHFVAVNLAMNGEGHYLGHNGRDRNMHDELHDIWRSFLTAGRIDEPTYVRGTFQNFYKTEAQFLAPFRSGWTVHEVQTRWVACPYRARFEADGDTARFAAGLMRTVRSWSAHTFRGALPDSADPSGIVDALYAEFQRRIAAAPSEFSMDYVQNYLWAEKTI